MTHSTMPSLAGNGRPRATAAPVPACINLRQRFGRQFKVAYEGSYQAQYGRYARVDDPWLQVIPGRRGHV